MTPELALVSGIMLIPYALGWLILVLRPRWTFLFAFTAAMWCSAWRSAARSWRFVSG